MAYRLMAHHRLRFSPQYVSSSSSIYSKTQRRHVTLDVKTSQEFDDKVLKSKLPVIVDFHARRNFISLNQINRYVTSANATRRAALLSGTLPTLNLPIKSHLSSGWCGPCKALAPMLTSVMDTYEGKANLAKVDVDELEDLAMEYGVMSVPTVIALKDGKIIDQFIGVKQADELHKFVDKVLE